MKAVHTIKRSFGFVILALSLCEFVVADEGLYESATLMFNNGEYELALQDYSSIIDLGQGGDLEAKSCFYAAESLFQLGRHEEASGKFRLFLKNYPSHQRRSFAQYRFAEVSSLLGKYKIAAKAYLRFVDENEGDDLIPKALYNAASSLMELGEGVEAEKVLEKLVLGYPSHSSVEDAKYFMACARFKEKNFVAAAEAFIDFAEQYPKSKRRIDAWFRAAETYSSEGDHRKSLVFYNKVLAEGRGSFRKDCHVGIAWSYYRLKEFEKAGNYFLKLAREESSGPERAEYYYQGLRSYYDGDRSELGALVGKEMLKACADEPIFGDVNYWLGLFSIKEGRDEEAAHYLKLAVDDQVKYVSKATILFERGKLLQKQGILEEAITVYKKALDLVKSDGELEAQIRYEASRALHQMGRTAEAKNMVKGNLVAGGSVVSLSEFSMGEFKYSEGDYAGAISHYQKVSSGDEGDKAVVEDALYRIAWCWRNLEQAERSRAAFEKLESMSERHRQEARYLIAESYRLEGDFVKAASWYEKVGDVEGVHGAHARLSMARMYFDQSQLKPCLQALSALSREFPDSEVDLEARLLMAEAHYGLGGFDSALAQYGHVIDRGEGGLLESALYGRSWILFEQEAFDATLKDLDRLLELFPESSYRQSALQLKGQVFMFTDRLEQARSMFNLGLGKSQGDESMLLNLAAVETDLGNFDKALEVYNQILSRFPDKEIQGRVTYEKGWLYMEMGRENEALLMFKAYRSAHQGGPLIDDANFALGQLAYDRAAYDEAIEAYSRCVLSERYMAKAYYKIGFSRLKLEDYGRAAESFEKLVMNSPDSPLVLEALYRVGNSWLKAMSFEKAVDALKNYVERGRSDSFYEDALGDLAIVNEKLGRVDDAIDNYERYLKLFPKGRRWVEINVYLGKLLLKKGIFLESREAFARALSDKTHFLALETQFLEGQAYFMEGRFEDAIRSYLKTQLYKDGLIWQAKGMLRIGLCHRELKRFDRARHYFDRVLSKYPSTDAAKDAVDALRDLPKS